jgi:hypothetical protein
MLLRTIETFLRENDMAPSRFGRDAGGDPRLVFELRKGRTLRPATEARLTAWMRDYREPVA